MLLNPFPLSFEAVLAMEPEKLADALREYVEFQTITSLDTKKERENAQLEMNRTVAYTCYFRDMEMYARICKRKARGQKDTKEADRLLGIEEVFGTYKKIAEQHYEYVLRTMTLTRIGLEEEKEAGHTT